MSAFFIHAYRVVKWTPKSFAIAESSTPGSRFLATRTTSSRNSLGYGLDTVNILPAQPLELGRLVVTYPCSRPFRRPSLYPNTSVSSGRGCARSRAMDSTIEELAMARRNWWTGASRVDAT